MDLHIEDFYKDAAKGLLALYQSFPRKATLYVEDLIGREEPDQFGLPSVRHQSCFSALLWLAEEDYLRYTTNLGYDALDQAILTEKAFLRLSASHAHLLKEAEALPPSVRRQRSTLAQHLRDALAESDSERVVLLTRLLLRPANKTT
ncbi:MULTISPECIES: hypothetical protein [Pseudomonas]|uniref:Uncharacterized protein n=2 Tax=Pseudomonas TaxID=286 RepID=A0A2X2D7F7_PSELU|nr:MULTISPECIES: hypothetical protein [Pseudomonas]AYN94164.1 hypothetical protein EAW52_09385 [Pseudomonas sp. LTJR-52]ENA36498.1 hypothetical protein HMPREF1487_04661 [Pseudomonas sp. HPB0071]MBA1246790.1 hypothetical protein [Pseudomonas zeshuii]MBF8639843.1 hypothetical protein [Pseudomonas zeshuii]MBH3439257.1 hypothetical protein [Pseudomonas luteola]